jgi:hypothetical protein
MRRCIVQLLFVCFFFFSNQRRLLRRPRFNSGDLRRFLLHLGAPSFQVNFKLKSLVFERFEKRCNTQLKHTTHRSVVNRGKMCRRNDSGGAGQSRVEFTTLLLEQNVLQATVSNSGGKRRRCGVRGDKDRHDSKVRVGGGTKCSDLNTINRTTVGLGTSKARQNYANKVAIHALIGGLSANIDMRRKHSDLN